MREFEVIARESWVKELEKNYGNLVPLHPDVVTSTFGTITNVIGMLGRDRFHSNICRLHIMGKPLEASLESHISEVAYQLQLSSNLPKIRAVNIYLTFSFPHSHRQVDRGLDRASEAIGMVFEKVVAALGKKALGKRLEPSFLNVTCVGASSIAFTHMFYRNCLEKIPRAWYTNVFQLNELPEVSEEEVQRRFNLIVRDITFSTGRSNNFILHFPHISSFVEGDVTKHGLFNDKLVELLEFLIELLAERWSYIKTEGTSEALDLEFDIPYEKGMILIPSTVNYRQLSLDKMRWFTSTDVLNLLKERLKDRIYIIGLFSSINMLNSVKSFIGSNVRALAIQSKNHECKYLVALEISKNELEYVVEKLLERSRLKQEEKRRE
jgi:hypothetical protein